MRLLFLLITLVSLSIYPHLSVHAQTQQNVVSLSLRLHGIGNAGDNSNPQSTGTTNPLHPQRTASLEIYNALNQRVVLQDITVIYNAQQSAFLGTATITGLSAGAYTAKVKLPQYLRKQYPGIVTISTGQSVSLPAVTMIAGDANNDNALSILDYNLILDCFSDLLPPRNCSESTKKLATDITDDGNVNQFDYNLLLREMSVIIGDGDPTPTNRPPSPSVSPSLSPTLSPTIVVTPGNHGQPVTFSTQEIPLSEAELVNPTRGLFSWSGSNTIPQPEAVYDGYNRFTWRELEPSKDVYDFAPIEAEFTRQSKGQKGFKMLIKVRALKSSNSGISFPDYMKALMEKAWETSGMYVPDWNDPDFLDRAEKLLLALGNKYNNDPRISGIEVGMYGKYGEWHTYQITYPGPKGATQLTEASARRLVDMHVKAFPNKRVYMMSDHTYGLSYALSLSPRIGWARHSLGNTHFASVKDERWATLQDRWKTAPVSTEFFGPDNTDLALALNQVKEFHVTLVGNGNYGKVYSELSTTERSNWANLGKSSGYRFVLKSITLPRSIRKGSAFSLSSSWANRGVTPAYDPWNITYELRNAQNTTVWSGKSSLDVEKFLPGDNVSAADTFTIPTTIANGTYTVAIVVKDPANYRAPLKLAVRGIQTDGSYTLGSITVE